VIPGRRLSVLALALGLFALGLSSLLLQGAAGARRATTGHGRTVVVYGYQYERDWPAAGCTDSIDRWGMDECNCTSYVGWALSANGQRTDWFAPGAMDAWNWPNVARRAGLQVRAVPRVGAVAVWQGWFSPFLFDTRQDVRSRGPVFIYVPGRA
jgi:surface antigen